MLILCLLAGSVTAFANLPAASAEVALKVITGTVSGEDGEPLEAATVKIVGKPITVQTDQLGRFTVDADEGDVIEISAVGYASRQITVGASTSYNITLSTSFSEMDQVVVVGYGVQKKINLTGSVVQVSGQELTKRPSTNIQNLLQGKVSGLQVTQGSGKPGADNAEMRIRGVGTFSGAGSDPMVMIDGVMGDMTSLNPDDIESVSVLKDAASAAIYGARAANGVILITTKRGAAGELSIQYHGNVQAQQATRLPKLVTNSADYMTLWNEALVRDPSRGVPYFTQQTIDAYRNANDPVRYPNFDWVDHVFRTGLAHNHHIGISGGNDRTRFNLAMGYLDQDGIMSIYDFKKYNVMLSVDTRVRDWITVGGNIQLSKRDVVQENFGDNDFVMSAYSGPNYTPTMVLPDGSIGYVARYSNDIGEWTVRNPDAISASGSRKINIYDVRPQIYADIKLTQDLKWFTKAAIGFRNEFNKRHEYPVDNYYFDDGSYAHNNAIINLGVQDIMTQLLETTLFSTLQYNKTFNDHNLTVLAGYSQESYYNRELRGSKINFPTSSIAELNAGSDVGQTTRGTAGEWAIQSLFGRINYDFKGRYLLEANARYDGTSRIAPETRWGVFPSLSAGWIISEESFFRGVDWLDNLKLRASWGKLGNQNIDFYAYQDRLSITSYPFDGLMPGVQLVNLRDRSLRWETTAVTDFGIDLSMKNGLISLTADWFNKVTDDILYQIPIPASVGLGAPTVNFGKMKNTGWEFELGHRNRVGDLSYNVNFNFSTFKNELLEVLSPSYGTRVIKEGLPFNSYYLIEWEGIFQSVEEIEKAPAHPNNPQPGDLRYRDANGDGVINSEDRVVVDGAYAKFYYGGSLNLAWKNFDLSAFFQGVQGNKLYVGGAHMAWGYTPFTQGSPPTLDFVKNRWTPSNPTNTTPAIFHSQYLPNTGTHSTYWLLDASYVRLKNLAIGYNFAENVYRSIGLKGLRLYVSGDNLITITKYPGADPERSCTGCRFSVYPQVTTYTVGAKATL